MPTTDKADPREVHQKPPFQEDRQPPPALDADMKNRPDHGEHTYQGFGRMKGKVVLITGGDSGIGKAAAIAYAREGANVGISFLPEEQKDAQDTIGWIEKAGVKGLALPGDIT